MAYSEVYTLINNSSKDREMYFSHPKFFISIFSEEALLATRGRRAATDSPVAATRR